MKELERKRERFLRDPLSRRLGAIAADLARIASSARSDSGRRSVELLLEEGARFIEWTAEAAPPDVGEELVDIQLRLSLWRRAWSDLGADRRLRALLALDARQWSDRVLERSGLLGGE